MKVFNDLFHDDYSVDAGPMKHNKPFELNDIKNFAKDVDAQVRLESNKSEMLWQDMVDICAETKKCVIIVPTSTDGLTATG